MWSAELWGENLKGCLLEAAIAAMNIVNNEGVIKRSFHDAYLFPWNPEGMKRAARKEVRGLELAPAHATVRQQAARAAGAVIDSHRPRPQPRHTRVRSQDAIFSGSQLAEKQEQTFHRQAEEKRAAELERETKKAKKEADKRQAREARAHAAKARADKAKRQREHEQRASSCRKCGKHARKNSAGWQICPACQKFMICRECAISSTLLADHEKRCGTRSTAPPTKRRRSAGANDSAAASILDGGGASLPSDSAAV